MVREIHAIVEALRGQLGLNGQFPTRRDTLRLLEECFPGLSVIDDDTPTPYLLVAAAGAVIVLPRGLGERERDGALLEELGHVLFDGAAAGASRHALGRLLSAQDARCERSAALFVSAWRLPIRLMRDAEDNEVMEETGCSRQEVADRRSTIGNPWL